MGNPLIWSFDSEIFYPRCVVPCAKYVRIHPNWITLFNCLIKYWAFCAILTWSPWRLLVWGTLERFLDCLDGVVARKQNKMSTFGHWMDKSTDMVYRWSSAAAAIGMCVPLLAQDLWAPGSLIAISVLCPGVYIYDGYHGHIDKGNTSAKGVAIYLEDNATLLCAILPMMQWWVTQRCQVGV